MFWAYGDVPFGDCDVLVATIEAVKDADATNAHPPTVLLRVEEVLSGFLKRGRLRAVWSEHLSLLCGVGAEEATRAWSAQKPHGLLPRVGERWIVAGGMNRERTWFEVVPYNRFRYTRVSRDEALRGLSEELAADPRGRDRRRRQAAEDRAATRDDELVDAVKTGHVARVRKILRSGVRASATDVDEKSALVWASEAGAVEIVGLLLAAGARVDGGRSEPAREVTGYYGSPLNEALEHGHEALIPLLVEAGANVEHRFGFTTPLMQAASEASCRTVEVLLKAGARPGVRGREGATALHYAAGGGRLCSMRLLIGAGADPHIGDDLGLTPLMNAAWAGQAGAVELLLGTAGGDIERSDDLGATPLMRAAAGGSTEAVGLLLSRGADPRRRDPRGRTAADWARSAAYGRADDGVYAVIAETLRKAAQ